MTDKEKEWLESFHHTLAKYRKAMMLRWIHPSQDEAARSLAMLVSMLEQRGLLRVGPREAE